VICRHKDIVKEVMKNYARRAVIPDTWRDMKGEGEKEHDKELYLTRMNADERQMNTDDKDSEHHCDRAAMASTPIPLRGKGCYSLRRRHWSWTDVSMYLTSGQEEILRRYYPYYPCLSVIKSAVEVCAV
jgi:hypothetical protein